MKNIANQRGVSAPRTYSAFKLSPVAAGCAMLLSALSGAAYAQDSSAGASASPAEPAVQSVTVSGIRRGIEAAIAVKKDATSIVGAISAEDIGKLPDTSIAESIAALPGLTAQYVDRFGDAGVRQFADVFGRDGFDDGGRIFLDGDGRLDAAADARHGHRLHRRFGGAGAGAGAAVLRVGRAGQCRQQHGAAGCDWAQFKGAVSTRRADASLVGDIFHQIGIA